MADSGRISRLTHRCCSCRRRMSALANAWPHQLQRMLVAGCGKWNAGNFRCGSSPIAASHSQVVNDGPSGRVSRRAAGTGLCSRTPGTCSTHLLGAEAVAEEGNRAVHITSQWRWYPPAAVRSPVRGGGRKHQWNQTSKMLEESLTLSSHNKTSPCMTYLRGGRAASPRASRGASRRGSRLHRHGSRPFCFER